MAQGTISTIRIAPCKVTFGTTYLGTTIGGVDVTLKTTSKQIVVDSFGTSITREFITQRLVTVKVPLAESDVAALNSMLAGTGSYIDTNTATTKQMTLPASIGLDMAASGNATALYLNTLPTGVDPYYCTYIMPRANMTGDISFSIKSDDVRVYTAEFTAYPDAGGSIMYFHENPHG